MTDLVERLRNWTRVYLCDDGRPNGSLYHDAADRIEELESEVRRLRARLEWVRTQNETPPFISLTVADTLLKESGDGRR